MLSRSFTYPSERCRAKEKGLYPRVNASSNREFLSSSSEQDAPCRFSSRLHALECKWKETASDMLFLRCRLYDEDVEDKALSTRESIDRIDAALKKKSGKDSTPSPSTPSADDKDNGDKDNGDKESNEEDAKISAIKTRLDKALVAMRTKGQAILFLRRGLEKKLVVDEPDYKAQNSLTLLKSSVDELKGVSLRLMTASLKLPYPTRKRASVPASLLAAQLPSSNANNTSPFNSRIAASVHKHHYSNNNPNALVPAVKFPSDVVRYSSIPPRGSGAPGSPESSGGTSTASSNSGSFKGTETFFGRPIYGDAAIVKPKEGKKTRRTNPIVAWLKKVLECKV